MSNEITRVKVDSTTEIEAITNGSEGEQLTIVGGEPAWAKHGATLYERPFDGGSVSTGAIEFANSELYNDSSNITKLSNTQVELKANHRYIMEGGLNANVTTPTLGYVDHQFYDATAASVIGVKGTLIIATSSSNSGSTTQAKAIISPTVDTIIEIHHVGGDGITSHGVTLEILEL